MFLIVGSVSSFYITQAQYFDVICINRYFGWYDDAGILEIIFKQVTNDVYQWWNKYKKPVLMTEYGADTVDGFHQVLSNNSVDYLNSFNAALL